ARAAVDKGINRFIYTGTIASYDMSNPSTVIDELTAFPEEMEDRNVYARSKAECERQLLELYQESGLPLSIVRPGIVLGKGGPLQHWGIGRWQGAGAIKLWGSGKNILPFVLNSDVALGLVLVMKSELAIGKSYNLVGDSFLTGRDYFREIKKRLNADIDVSSGNLVGFWLMDIIKSKLKRVILRERDTTAMSLSDWKSRAHLSRFSNQKAKEDLGWQPISDREDFLMAAIDDANLFGF
ncbi:MAG: NAD(P)-dependent oxidoreductase, partial [Pseudomonadota bacterium]